MDTVGLVSSAAMVEGSSGGIAGLSRMVAYSLMVARLSGALRVLATEEGVQRVLQALTKRELVDLLSQRSDDHTDSGADSWDQEVREAVIRHLGTRQEP